MKFLELELHVNVGFGRRVVDHWAPFHAIMNLVGSVDARE